MAIYTVQINKNNKSLTLGANDNVCYDNYLWWQLDQIVSACDSNQSLDQISKDIKNLNGWFEEIKSNEEPDVVIDLDNNTITKPYFPLYKFDKVNKNECRIGLVIKDGKYFAQYDDGKEYEIEHAQFADIDLLKKGVVSLSEFKKISKLVMKLTNNGGSEFILNDEFVVVFQLA